MQSPGFTKPTHEYGISLSNWDAPVAGGSMLAEESWAGEGFTLRDEESTT